MGSAGTVIICLNQQSLNYVDCTENYKNDTEKIIKFLFWYLTETADIGLNELESTKNNVDGEPEAKRRKTVETEEARSNGDIEASAINELLQGLYATCTCL